MWDRVVGQERAVGLLQRAAERPVHAYLLVGPRGSGLEDAARCFAGEVVAPDHDQGVQDLVLRGMHPDVVEFEPEGNQILVAQAEAVIREAHRAPIEAEHKVVAVFEADRLNEQASNKLLKTIEEPPSRSTIMLVTSSPDELLETVRSRCQRIDLAPLPEAALRDALVHERAGYPERPRTALLKRQAERHRRQHRRARTDLLLEGITALESVYRDALAGKNAPLLNTDRPVLELTPRACMEAIDACREARDAFEFNPNETLLLE